MIKTFENRLAAALLAGTASLAFAAPAQADATPECNSANTNSTECGEDAVTTGDGAVAVGTGAVADGTDAVAIGSPHLSPRELEALERLVADRKLAVPLFACTGRHALDAFGPDRRAALERAGVVIVADTCVVVTPIMAEVAGGVLMTNSGKFAQYAPGNTGYAVLYASLADCVESAVTGRPVLRELAA